MITTGRTAPAAPLTPDTEATVAPFPGTFEAMDGSTAVVLMETAASEGAGAYPITPSTQMGEGWAAAVAEGKRNVNGRRLLFFEPEGEHAAAAVTAGMSMTGLRAANFSSGQGVVYMHESLYPAVGKRLTYVLNMAARAITKHALNVHAGHDDYHAVDDTGFFQLFAKGVQEAADLNLVAHRVAELSLNPGIIAQDGFLTSHVIESMRLPERDLIKTYLGDPADLIDSPTPAQRLVFGDQRRRIPELFDVDYPAMLGVVQNQDSYAQGVAAQRPFYFDHVAELTDRAMDEFARLTGRRYARASGYRLDDAEWVIVGQGSVVANAEAVADHLRTARGLKVGVLDLTMFRPFPADLVTRLLAGKRGVVVLERTDQPLAVDPPLLRELRAAMTQALENGRARAAEPARRSTVDGLAALVFGGNGRGSRSADEPAQALPYPKLASLAPEQMPDFFSGCFGLGSRDLQPGDIAAAVLNMLPDAPRRRQFYLGIDFVRPGTRLPKLQLWQEQLLESYPHVAELSLPSAGDLHLMPEGALSLRIHSVGGWGAITMGKNLSMTVFELLGMHVKANPKYGSEKKGQPTTFYATFAHEPIRLNCELRHVDVVLSPDPNVFRHSNPLAGLEEGGTFIMQSDQSPAELWASLPATARAEIVARKIRVFALDAFRIAADEASDPELRYRMQGAAFMGAFFAASPLLQRESLSEQALFDGVKAQMLKKFGAKGERVVEDNLRVIRRGWSELKPVEPVAIAATEAATATVPRMPASLDVPAAQGGVGNPGRFWEQVCSVNKCGQDVLADPFTAISAIPAATSAVRDMTGVRLEVPQFIAEKCTGCAQCWTQCPDAAIPGLVSDPEDILTTAVDRAALLAPVDRLRPILKPLAKEVRRVVGTGEFDGMGAAIAAAWTALAPKLALDDAKRAGIDEELVRVREAVRGIQFARTASFWDAAERRQKGSGGLLSVTINPEACKGCNLCVDVCPDGALVSVKQDDEVVGTLRDRWDFWQRLPDTPRRFVNVKDIDQGIGVLPTLLLQKQSYRSMAGGDGACMGCGEKTAVHLVTATVESLMRPRVERFVERIDALVAGLDAKARTLLAADADLDAVPRAASTVPVHVDPEKAAEVERIAAAIRALRDLRWRYVEGPGGRGRAHMGMANSTGCSSVWASTFPFNPYPFPWANHLFQDSPSLAIGIFEGHMRKMADGFVAVRRAQALLDGEYDAERTERELADLDWKAFSDEEFGLCPPIVAMGGDGAMLDIGFQNLSRLMASGKPLRVIVLDTQVYSNTGGQACTSGFTGQVADMSWYGAAQHGKTEVRKELALVAMAHRGVFVHQTSQATASHLMAGVLKGLNARRPALINIYTPCPVEHGLPDDWAQHSARLALESRAFPYLTYDPDAGRGWSECLSLEGNPAIDDDWPTYVLKYVDDEGKEAELELPLTTADWAATEGRFRKHFKPVKRDAWNDDMVPFHEYLALPAESRDGKVPYIRVLGEGKRLARWSVSKEIVTLAEERQLHWAQLRELAGVLVPQATKDRVREAMEAELADRLAAAEREHEAKLADLRASYPPMIAKRLAESLIRASRGGQTVAELVSSLSSGIAPSVPVQQPLGQAPPTTPNEKTAETAQEKAEKLADSPFSKDQALSVQSFVGGAGQAPPKSADGGPVTATAMEPATSDDDAVRIEAYIESDRCTSCNECTNVNRKMFAYNANKQAYVKDATAGTFAQLVQAAEKCPVGAIHPGTPLNPKEKDLDKWLKRAQAF